MENNDWKNGHYISISKDLEVVSDPKKNFEDVISNKSYYYVFAKILKYTRSGWAAYFEYSITNAAREKINLRLRQYECTKIDSHEYIPGSRLNDAFNEQFTNRVIFYPFSMILWQFYNLSLVIEVVNHVTKETRKIVVLGNIQQVVEVLKKINEHTKLIDFEYSLIKSGIKEAIENFPSTSYPRDPLNTCLIGVTKLMQINKERILNKSWLDQETNELLKIKHNLETMIAEQKKTDRRKANNLPRNISELAGEYFVAAELCRRGYAVGMTTGNNNTMALIAEKDTIIHHVQVKTINSNRKVGWPFRSDMIRSDVIYVLVNLNEINAPDYYILKPEEMVPLIHDYFKSKRGVLRLSSIKKNDKFKNRWDKI